MNLVSLGSFLLATCGLLGASATAQNCQNTSVGFVPLNDLGAGQHLGSQGGLYPGGANVRPAAHEAAGLAQAAQVVPRDAAGNPDPVNGEIVFLSIGMSNTNITWNQFMPLYNADPARNPQVRVIQGAQGGQPANQTSDINDDYWPHLDSVLVNANVSPLQVQVLWMLQAHSGPTNAFPTDAQLLRDDLRAIVQILRDKFPNARLCYLGSRIYAGYATTMLNPEPFAYQQSFANKWLIEEQIQGSSALVFDPANGVVEAPWLAWGYYSWADGLIPRSDGLIWQCPDFNPDGTHPSAQGALKVATSMHEFFKSDSVASSWYLTSGGPVATGTPYCFGDGTSAPCPCGNNGQAGHGCANSDNTDGALFTGSGIASVANDSLVLHATGLTTSATVLFFQGTGAPNGGLGVPFGDGVRCVGGNIIRLSANSAAGGSQDYPGPGDQAISVRGQIPVMGATRFYSAWYRDTAAGFCSPQEFNFSNGLAVTWAP